MNLLVIEADKGESTYWLDLWRYRELFFFLSWRDILVRYKQTVIGIFWAIIRPLLQMIILTFVFGNLARMGSDGLRWHASLAVLLFVYDGGEHQPDHER
jgi:lipopolysaccharide transport system permease protein